MTTPYSPGATMTVGRTGSASLLRAATDSVLQVAGSYSYEEPKSWGGSSATTLATISGSPAAGASVLYVFFTVPLV